MAEQKAKDVKIIVNKSQLFGHWTIDFNNLEWEPKAYRENNKSSKKLFYFDDSQKRLVNTGYQRHPFSAEAFALICTYLDDEKNKTNLLNEQQTEIAKDMLTSYGEWFCQAIKTEQNSNTKTVKFYELVTALPKNQENNGYDESGLKHSGQAKEFDISDLELGSCHYYKNIHQKHNDLIMYTHSRKFNDLPAEIKEIGGIYLSNPGNMWPAGRGAITSHCRFDIISCSYDRASRGMREKKCTPALTRNEVLEDLLVETSPQPPNPDREPQKRQP